MKKLITALLLASVLTACGPAATPEPTATLIPTSTPAPSATPIPSPTPINMASVDLESILVLDGDLPSDFVGGQVTAKPPRTLGDLPEWEQAIQRGFRTGDYASDGPTIILYSASDEAQSVYQDVLERLKKDKDELFASIDSVGDMASVSSKRDAFWPVTHSVVLFTRCNAFVYIELYATSANAEMATTYAARLDKRVQKAICPAP